MNDNTTSGKETSETARTPRRRGANFGMMCGRVETPASPFFFFAVLFNEQRTHDKVLRGPLEPLGECLMGLQPHMSERTDHESSLLIEEWGATWGSPARMTHRLLDRFRNGKQNGTAPSESDSE